MAKKLAVWIVALAFALAMGPLVGAQIRSFPGDGEKSPAVATGQDVFWLVFDRVDQKYRLHCPSMRDPWAANEGARLAAALHGQVIARGAYLFDEDHQVDFTRNPNGLVRFVIVRPWEGNCTSPVMIFTDQPGAKPIPLAGEYYSNKYFTLLGVKHLAVCGP